MAIVIVTFMFFSALLVTLATAQDSMNGDYPPPINALPNFQAKHRGRYFELLSHPVTFQYSEVYWTAQPGISLPADVVAEFKGRAISFTGFEVDVMRLNSSGGYESVPAYDVYNHHYCCTIIGAGSKMTFMGPPGLRKYGAHVPDMEPHAKPNDPFPDSIVPTAHNFWQGNGGEHRKSFKYLPEGFGQVLIIWREVYVSGVACLTQITICSNPTLR